MEPVPDLIVFDWVLALGSTQAAASLLGLPQSSVSRRYRALADRFGIATRRQHGSWFVTGSGTTLRLLRELIQHYRLERQAYRWTWQPDLLPLLDRLGRIGSGSTFIRLDHGHWHQRLDFLQSRILDLSFEICSDPLTLYVGVVSLGVHLHVPADHALNQLPADQRVCQLRQYPVSCGSLTLLDELKSQLRGDGFRLASNAEMLDGTALELRLGRAVGDRDMPLPYRLPAGWRVPSLLDGMVFSPTALAQLVDSLDVDPISEESCLAADNWMGSLAAG